MSHRNRRLANRHEVRTTPIRWRVAKRRRNGSAGRVVVTDAAVVEVSSVGAGIVCPNDFIAPLGTVMVGVIVLHEQLLPVHLAGIAVIFVGLIFLDGRLVRRRAPS